MLIEKFESIRFWVDNLQSWAYDLKYNKSNIEQSLF